MRGSDQLYRPDIDGLRAVAVASVVLFHTHSSWVPGGFVGVDVFFVISGFLITGIILDRGSLSREFFAWFYERRIRRLFPAIVPVIIVTSLLAYRMLPPPALEEFGESLVAFMTFWSNWFFWSIAGYFDGPAQSKPLLHTWSLSIEEQFYLLFPIMILFTARRGRSAVVGLFLAITLASLALSAWLVWAGDADNAFYNSFGRFWQISVGSLLATGFVRPPQTALAKTALGTAGLTAIAYAVFVYSKETPFPGLAAALPVAGAAAVILARGGAAGWLLSTRPMVGLGLISYALYLWHWPLFVFLGQVEYHPSALHHAAAIAVSLLLAIVSYFLIEQPFRRKRYLPARRSAFAMFGAGVAAFAVIGASGVATSGFPDRFPGMAEYNAKLADLVWEWRQELSQTVCWVSGTNDMDHFFDCAAPEVGRINVLLLGDFHAALFFGALSRVVGPGVNVDMLALNSCSLRRGNYPGCDRLLDWIGADLPAKKYDTVVISIRGAVANATGMRKTEITVAEVLELARSIAKHTPVTIFGPITYYEPYMPDTYAMIVGNRTTEQIDAIFDDAVQPEQFEVDAQYRVAVMPEGVRYVSLLSILCPGGPASCRHFDANHLPILVDASHMSLAAAIDLLTEASGQFPWQPATAATPIAGSSARNASTVTGSPVGR